MTDALNEQQTHALESSFALLAPNGEEIAASFYQRLFTDYPAVRPLFEQTDPQEQQKKLLSSLVLVVQNLRSPEKLDAALDRLGQRHGEIGATPAQYDAVGQTLLKTLAEYAGSLWDDELEEAWTAAYGLISSRMLAAQASYATA
ncbi:MAG: globin family protein [Planctomycetota bacterium]